MAGGGLPGKLTICRGRVLLGIRAPAHIRDALELLLHNSQPRDGACRRGWGVVLAGNRRRTARPTCRAVLHTVHVLPPGHRRIRILRGGAALAGAPHLRICRQETPRRPGGAGGGGDDMRDFVLSPVYRARCPLYQSECGDRGCDPRARLLLVGRTRDVPSHGERPVPRRCHGYGVPPTLLRAPLRHGGSDYHRVGDSLLQPH
mmetsp:Transcript_6535/g.14399  ORF Transcript_6535/g.14399 Transcript_6535/m.14399 type:complete len:203 (-) Transcript_6535:91-699(-)